MNFDLLRSDYNSFLEQLSSPDLGQKERAQLQRQVTSFGQLLELYDQKVAVESELAELKEQLAGESDAELKEMFTEEIATLEPQVAPLQEQLDELLYPTDEHNERSVFVEIRAGAGGQEAALFGYDLFAAYRMYAEKKGWNISIVEASTTDIGGYKELTAHVKGNGVYKMLKHESGVHRVQRVPATETQGRVHTSTVTVAVLPEAEDVDVDINPNDLRIDTYRAGGAGGQHVNKTDSAVRITHIPTGVVVQCQDERSQLKNKNKAMKVLRSRLLEEEKKKQSAEQSENRRQQVGSGDRSEKIRTYNYPQNRISDHRINLTLKKLDIVMQSGALDEILEPLVDHERKARRTDDSPYKKYM